MNDTKFTKLNKPDFDRLYEMKSGFWNSRTQTAASSCFQAITYHQMQEWTSATSLLISALPFS